LAFERGHGAFPIHVPSDVKTAMESGLREENPVPLTAVVGGMTTVALLTLVAQAADCPLLSVHERRSRPHASDAARPILLLRARRTEEKRKKATG
jgi:hypothetical protein